MSDDIKRNSNGISLLDYTVKFKKFHVPDRHEKIAELLAETNVILEDMVWITEPTRWQKFKRRAKDWWKYSVKREPRPVKLETKTVFIVRKGEGTNVETTEPLTLSCGCDASGWCHCE